MSMPAPPGFLSPAAFPFTPPFPQNDAPAAGAPYLIGTKSVATGTTLTLTVNAGSNAGDTIVVFTGQGSPPATCTDTEGNSYSLTVPLAGGSERIGQFTAVNPSPLKPGDSISATWTGGGIHSLVVIGLPGAGAGVPGGNLIPDVTGTFFGGTTAQLTGSIAASSLSSPAEVAVAFAMVNPLATTGPFNWQPDWTVLICAPLPAAPANQFTVAYKILTSKAKITANFLFAGAQTGSGLIITTFMRETRFAPRGPRPDMPPGLQSPGAWQYAPLSAPEGAWSTRYNPGPNKWAETLPAVTVTGPALTRATGKTLAATPAAHGALARTAAHLRTLAAVPHAAAALAKRTGKHLATTAHPAGKLTRATGKTLAATTRAAASLARGSAKRLAARAVSAARLLAYGPAPSFTLGVPRLEWNVSISTTGLSHLSTQYVPVPVAATRNGVSYNPTGDTVTFAFMPTPTQVPGSGDWIAGSWETATSSLLYPYNARCLVGPAGTVTLGIGTYIVYIRINDNPEAPVLIAGQLQIF